jgi:hypothetical protein
MELRRRRERSREESETKERMRSNTGDISSPGGVGRGPINYGCPDPNSSYAHPLGKGLMSLKDEDILHYYPLAKTQ